MPLLHGLESRGNRSLNAKPLVVMTWTSQIRKQCEIRCDEILGQGSGNIGGVLDDFLHVLVLT